MRRTKLLSQFGMTTALFVAACAMAMGEDEDKKAQLNEKAPDFTLVDSTGQQRSLSDYAGRLIVLEWINPDCPYVVRCYGSKAMQTAYEKVKELDGSVAWLAINTTRTTTAEQNNFWIKKHGLKYPILLDPMGEVGQVYGARRTPHMFVIDKEGILRYHGAIDDNKYGDKKLQETTNYVVNAVQQIVDGETVTPDRTKPYGCTVKYARR